jgi:hypothetical protein
MRDEGQQERGGADDFEEYACDCDGRPTFGRHRRASAWIASVGVAPATVAAYRSQRCRKGKRKARRVRRAFPCYCVLVEA